MKHASAMRRGRAVGAKRARGGFAAGARCRRACAMDARQNMRRNATHGITELLDTVTPSPLPRVTWSACLIHPFIEHTPPIQAECGVDIQRTSCYMNRRGTQSPAASHAPRQPHPSPPLMPRLLAQLLAIWHLCGDDPVGLGLVPNLSCAYPRRKYSTDSIPIMDIPPKITFNNCNCSVC